MNTAVAINLNYVAVEADSASALYSLIEERLLGAGFFKNKRLFLSHLMPSVACVVAKQAIDDLDQDVFGGAGRIYSFLMDFYAFDYNNAENLMLPSLSQIEAMDLPVDLNVELVAA